MTLQDVKDVVDIVSKLALPFVLAFVGLLLSRRIEAQKAGVSRSSDFKRRWADSFFDASQDFMRFTERYMSILNQLQGMSNPNTPFGTKLQEELNELNVRLGELGLRIKRLSLYAHRNGASAIQTSQDVQDYLGQTVKNLKGSFDRLILLQNSFNEAVRAAHAEMLELE